MADQRFRGDPYAVLDVRHDASDVQIKRRWRELARQHHPDRAAGDTDAAARLTARMARINAAYDLLRDPLRRGAWDSSGPGRRARTRADDAPGSAGAGLHFEDDMAPGGAAGPPPPPRSTPVTGRFDTTAAFRPHNARVNQPAMMRGQRPLNRRDMREERDLRASTPTGPIEKLLHERPERAPTLQEARETTLNFGRFHGYTLGEVELLEPAYLDWVSRTITRDRDLVVRARVIQAELARRGKGATRSAAPDFGSGAATG